MGDYSKKKLRDRQFGEHKTSSMFNDTPLLPNKAIDMSSTSSTLCAYTVDTAPGTHTDTNNNTSNTCSLNTYTVDDTPKTIADSLPDSNTTDKITSSSDHAPSTSTSNTTFCADIITSAPDPSRISHDSVTSEGTQNSSTPDSTPSGSSESAPISENAHIPSSVNNALRPSGADSISNNTGAYTENDHGKRENNMRGGDDKQISGGKQKKALSSNAALKGKPRNPVLLPMSTQAKYFGLSMNF